MWMHILRFMIRCCKAKPDLHLQILIPFKPLIMCGIVGYIGYRDVYTVLINGLKRLEYRGYDSAGIAILNSQSSIYKCKGKVSDLERFISGNNVSGTIGMGHTRWATHGEPNDVNAHPHKSFHGKFILIHNGIIENYARLKERLITLGIKFQSETDSEVLVNLIEYIYEKAILGRNGCQDGLVRSDGAYGIVVMCTDEPDKLIAARKGSPLVIGVGNNEYFIASDATPIVEYTKSVIYLNDNDVAVISREGLILKTLQNDSQIPRIQQLDLDIGEIDKGGYTHFMLKEIFEQPRSILDTFRGRVGTDLNEIYLGGLYQLLTDWLKPNALSSLAAEPHGMPDW